jgi:hypothetical protein
MGPRLSTVGRPVARAIGPDIVTAADVTRAIRQRVVIDAVVSPLLHGNLKVDLPFRPLLLALSGGRGQIRPFRKGQPPKAAQID